MTSTFVVVPFYNEAPGIEATLEALAAQTEANFVLVCVDNASTDGGAAVVRAFAARHPGFDMRLVEEPVKGTGVASDTGFRYAIAQGASHILRTDADCLPDPDWVRNIGRAFDTGAEYVVGRIKARRDQGFGLADALVLPALVWVAETYGKIARRGPEFKTGWVLAAGNNLAITASLYLESGGFPRTHFTEEGEDRALTDRVRRVSDRIVKRDDALVYNSIRRVRAYGYLNTLLWYWDRRFRPAVVDVR